MRDMPKEIVDDIICRSIVMDLNEDFYKFWYHYKTNNDLLHMALNRYRHELAMFHSTRQQSLPFDRYPLDKKFIEPLSSIISWYDITPLFLWSEEEVIKYDKYILWYKLYNQPLLSDSFIEKMIETCPCDKKYCRHSLFKNLHTTNRKFSEAFLEKYVGGICQRCIGTICMHRLEWVNISYCKHLSYDFIVRHQDQISWHTLSLVRNVDAKKIIGEFKERINWLSLSQYIHCHPDFEDNVIIGKDKVDWYHVCKNYSLTPKIVEACATQIKRHMSNMTTGVYSKELTESLWTFVYE